VGDSAEIRPTEGGSAYSGRVSYVAALVDPDTRATGVRVLVANPGGALKKDMFVRVTIRTRHERTGILVPASAVQRDEDNLPFLFVAMPDGSFARRQVQIGSRIGDHYQITSGVQTGDRIITEGGLFLRFAQSQ
jgi:cobalt-zinc-cadmium efflux system membrane fusion protein